MVTDMLMITFITLPVRRHNLQYHCYADDSQLYMSIKLTDNLEHIASTVEACVADISTWMSNNMLKVNQDKTEMIIFRPKQRVNTTHDMSIIVGGNTISSYSSVKGVYMDSALTVEKQVNAVTKSCYHQIRNIDHIRHYISNKVCKVLVLSLVTSRLDYGNAVLWHPTDIKWAFAASSELCCAPHHQNSQKGAHNTCVVPTSLAACTLYITL